MAGADGAAGFRRVNGRKEGMSRGPRFIATLQADGAGGGGGMARADIKKTRRADAFRA